MVVLKAMKDFLIFIGIVSKLMMNILRFENFVQAHFAIISLFCVTVGLALITIVNTYVTIQRPALKYLILTKKNNFV